MPIERVMPIFSLAEERLRALKQVLPEAFADGEINWETLKEALGERLTDEEGEAEHFGLFWHGKRHARRLASLPSKGTLAPVPGRGLAEETTENIFIEGDNLEVLKLLQKSYAGRIKVIYIDPPYNTGNDFIYKDDYREPLAAYLKKTRQTGEEGELLTTNPKSDGRFHTNWLNMMYPRLRLARNLLTKDGALFVSIDDNEAHHLRQMLNELCGEENFIAQLVWKKKYIGGKHARHYVDLHEYVLVFAKDASALNEILMPRPEAEQAKFDKVDEYVESRGKHYIRPLKSNLERRETLIYPIRLPDGSDVTTQWMVSKSTFQELCEEGRILFKRMKDGAYRVYRKFYQADHAGLVKVPSLFEAVANNDGKAELKTLFQTKEGRDIVFQNPKPTGLIRFLVEPLLKDGDVLLDFFAGSGTSAQTVMKLNKDDGGQRRFICVQLPEKIGPDEEAFKAGYETVAEIAEERIRRASQQLRQERAKELETGAPVIDLGFKIYRLQASNFKTWQDYMGDSADELVDLFKQFETTLVEGWKEQDVLSEVLLIEGFPLNAKIALDHEYRWNRVFRVESGACAHRLYISLDERVAEATIETIACLASQDVFICLDSALTDTAKLRLKDAGNIRTL